MGRAGIPVKESKDWMVSENMGVGFGRFDSRIESATKDRTKVSLIVSENQACIDLGYGLEPSPDNVGMIRGNFGCRAADYRFVKCGQFSFGRGGGPI